LPDIIAYSQRNIAIPRPVRSCRRFVQDSFILSFSLKSMTRGTSPNWLLSNPLQSHRFQIRNAPCRSGLIYAHRASIFRALEAKEHISSRSSRYFVPNDQKKVCAHDKCRKRADLWVKINLFNVFVMYALGSVHEKFDV